MTGSLELQPDNEPRSSLSIRPGFGRCSWILPKFARRFTEGIEKLAGNMSGDCRKKTERLTARMPEVAGLVGNSGGGQQLSVNKPPRWRLNCLYHRMQAMANG
ncbi:hypothetical protein B296_00035878 [Ensete ventricosum]|uniref:Uncharacterized protein n=1 Tax=Ensete ventricosum TaxID=4639 RepID=A0A426X9W9_ENSVE|nr:hypothetical protein B296_00035878 [Ensete ventricosum]